MQASKVYREERPWGDFVEFTRNTPSTVKIINVRPHEAFSLQRHKSRDEFWHVLSGNGFIAVGTQKNPIAVNGDYFIPRGTCHRLEAGDTPLVVLEIATGEFDENDVERLEDRYGRV